MFELTGRSALVTGAGAGIGASVAVAFAKAGAAVLVTDVNGDAAEKVAAQIVETGGVADSFARDGRNAKKAEQPAPGAAARANGTVHILVNNAGAIAPAMFPKLT